MLPIKTDYVTYYGRDRYQPHQGGYFKEYTFGDFPQNYSKDQYSYWKGLRHRQDTAEYFRSTQNDKYYRAEFPDELENRVMSPGNPLFFSEVTPERLAEDPGDVIYNFYYGWKKNQSDGVAGWVAARGNTREENKGNSVRRRNQTGKFMLQRYQLNEGEQFLGYE